MNAAESANISSTLSAADEAGIEACVRTLHCLLGVLRTQQNDELCKTCKSFSMTLDAARKKVIETESIMLDRSGRESSRSLLLSVYSILGEITEPEIPVPQRKSGACRLADGICMLTAPARLAGCA